MKTTAITLSPFCNTGVFAWRWPATGAAMLAVGLLTHQPIACGAALVVLLYAAGASPWLRALPAQTLVAPRVAGPPAPRQPEPSEEPPPSTTESLVRQML